MIPFKVIKQDDKERMQISFEGKADIYLIRTAEGFIIDVYDGIGENINTIAVWRDDFEE